ncbi:MAG: serine/threonine-protein kinase [Verrucomicrobiota bacterium]|nr:serine/threonine-protein kinase [Verrucomicrobiota bacterium]
MTQLKELSTVVGYELLRPIAEGGMGIVYEACQHGVDNFRKIVALKLIREEYSAIEEFRNNFVGEARLVADLIHTNIVQTYHLGVVHGQYYMVMEYVKGVNLEEFLYQHKFLDKPVPVDIAVFIMSRICRGLAYAHAKRDRNNNLLGIVHRDVNPRNIMLAYEGDVKLTDFGIAKALNLMYNEEGEVIAGKDEYLSPEQARREVTDARADLFCCAIVLSELLLGYNIFATDDSVQTRSNILHIPIPDFRSLRPDMDDRLNDIMHKAFQRARERRYQTADEMMLALELYLYSDGYGPTNEKLADYLAQIFGNGKAYWEHLNDSTASGNPTEAKG